tara:strand:+ start:2425 stop:2718 length:294 start_codon:yes stop_codon:yes gene_type:complete
MEDFEFEFESIDPEKEQEIMIAAIENSYLMLTGKLNLKDIVTLDEHMEIAITAYDPEEGPTETQLDTIIKHFEGTEEYEKCAEIKVIKDEMFPKKDS